jgi:hypothetical protein
MAVLVTCFIQKLGRIFGAGLTAQLCTTYYVLYACGLVCGALDAYTQAPYFRKYNFERKKGWGRLRMETTRSGQTKNW